jgi:hypothetical protein
VNSSILAAILASIFALFGLHQPIYHAPTTPSSYAVAAAASPSNSNTATSPTTQSPTATSTETSPDATSDQTTNSQNVKSAAFFPTYNSAVSNTPDQTTAQSLPTSNFVTQDELSGQLQQLSNSLTAKFSAPTASFVPEYVAANGNAAIPYAGANAIDNLSNVTITNANLTASEIPALDYLSLSGGSLSGDLSIGGNATTTGTSYFTGNVGIGTWTSQDALAVNGSEYLPNVAAPTITANRLYANANDLYWAGNLIAGAATGNWTTDGTNAWRAGGSVGIGTSSPFATLSVVGNGYLTGALTAASVNATNGTTTNATSTSLFSTFGDFTTGLINTLSGTTLSYSAASTTNFSNSGTAYFGGSAMTTIDSAGDLNVGGSLTANGNVTLGNATTASLFSTTASSTNLFANSGSFASLSGAAFSSLSSDYLPKWDNGSWINSLLYDNGTDIGIGTTSPSATLAVDGSGYFNGNLTATNYYGNISSSTVLATGGTTALQLGNIAAQVVNVKSFGATGKGVTDDTAAINAAISYIRNADDAAGQGSLNKYELYFPQGEYLIDSTINLTCYSDPNSISATGYDDGCRPNGESSEIAENHDFLPIIAYGAEIVCSTSGAPCIDGLGSRYVQIQGLTVYSSCNSASEPSWGIQIGRTEPNINADNWYFHSVNFDGCYNKAPYYNLAAESTTIDGDSWFQNDDTNNTFATSTGPYAGVWDTGNHWQITSAFVSEQIPKDTPGSFNGNTVVGGAFYPSSPTSDSGGIWIYGTRSLDFDDTYIVTHQPACITLYFDATSGGSSTGNSDYAPEDDTFDTHCEGSVSDVFFITGYQSDPIIKDMTFNERSVAPLQSSADVFALDSGVTGLTLQDVDMSLIPGATTVSLWDKPSAYTVSGTILLTANSSKLTWTQPGTWTGCVYIGTTAPSCGGLTSSGAFNITSLTGGALDFDGLSQLYASSTISSLFVGYQAGSNVLTVATSSSNTSGPFAVAVGQGALKNATSSAYKSVAVGYDALLGSASTGGISSSGSFGANTAVGWDALTAFTTGYQNSALGAGALSSVTTGTINVGIGLNAGLGITTATQNVAIGNQVMSQHNGSFNVAIGTVALQGNGTGANNVAIGSYAGNADTSGANDIFLGYGAASTTASGSNNIALGYDIALPSTNGSNQLDIGNLIYGTGLNGTLSTVSTGNVGIGTTTPYAPLEVWGPDSASSTLAFNVVNNASSTVFAVFDGGNAELGGTLTQSSDQRLKTNIQSLDATSSLWLIDSLNPVTFNWIDPNQGTGVQLGFVAQQVQQIFPNLVSTTSATALTPGGTLGLNYIGLISPIVSAIQALSSELSSIENAIAGFADSFTTTQLTFVRGQGTEIDVQTADVQTANVQTLCIGSTCITEAQLQALLAAAGQSGASTGSSDGSSSEDSEASDTPPVIQINGDNPAIVQVGNTYNDLGATITGPQADLNLGIETYLNGTLTSNIVIDTTQVATDTIAYVATDQSGLTSTSTRTIIIETAAAPSIVPTADASTTAATTTP